jgi:probable FeS assembly SUF system protein SufT
MSIAVPITLKRACEVIEIPSGEHRTLPEGTLVRISQSLGSSYTISVDYGYMFRIDARDADALGMTAEIPSAAPAELKPFSEQLVWDELKTNFDPEIPVNIVDLGLVYGCDISPALPEGKKIDIKMSMTAPGCGMGNVLKADVETRLARLPEVKEVQVEIVLDPAWSPARMSEAAKLQLGFDLDFGGSSDTLPMIR